MESEPVYPSDDPTLPRTRALEEKRQIDLDRLGELESRILQIQLDNLTREVLDHETRLRVVEEAATRFNFLLYLTMGGGLLTLLNLLALALLLVRAAP
jgi:hypothetical protein